MPTSTVMLNLPERGQPEWNRGSVYFVGTATVILRYAGFTILTDPNFLHAGDHVHLGYGLQSRRLTDPALDFEQLPAFDFVLLSHLHGDHFDQLVEQKLERATPILTTAEAAEALRKKGFRRTFGMRTWDSVVVSRGAARLAVTAAPARHGPGPLQRLLPKVMGSILEFGPAGDPTLRVYVSGDTLIHEDLKAIPARYPRIDLGLLHLGGTRLFGVLLTMDARQGVEAVRLIDARKSVPIHYDDYPVFKSPLADSQQAVREAGLEDRVHYLARGETYAFEVAAERLAPSLRRSGRG
jgi:L-ascorbate metabolism protein UlaG (beta-lactamase superfamily)